MAGYMPTVQPQSKVRRLPGQAPIIPEIAKAYVNDPRTMLARQAMANGTDGTPVAQGKYAYGDAIARVLQAGMGGYEDKRMRNQYGGQDDAMVAERAARAKEAIAAMAGGGTPPANVDPTTASAVAGAMGAPAPATPPVDPVLAAAGQAPVPPGGIPGGFGGMRMGAPPALDRGAPPPGIGGMPAPPPGMPPPGMPPGMPPPGGVPGMGGLPMRGLPMRGGMGANTLVGSAGADRLAGGPPLRPPQGVVLTDPLAGRGRVTSQFGDARPGGRTHDGTDYAAPAGTPIAAVGDGTVLRTWNDVANGGGNSVLIRHADGSISGYAHLGDFKVAKGDQVRGGQVIGTVGQTGNATGDSLHFTYRDPTGKRVNPTTLKFGQATDTQTPGDPAAVEGHYTPEQPGGDNYGIPLEAKPDLPAFDGPTRSRVLGSGYELASGGNPYESARSQDLIDKGNADQTTLDEAAAQRKYDAGMVGYRAGLDRYGADRTQARGERYGTSERIAGQGFTHGEAVDQRQFTRDERVSGQGFTASEAAKQRAYGTSERIGGQDFSAGQAALDRQATSTNLDKQLGSKEQIAAGRNLQQQAQWEQTGKGAQYKKETDDAVAANNATIAQLGEFTNLNDKEPTGNWRTALGPVGRFGDSKLQRMEAISQTLQLQIGAIQKGALSEGDAKRIAGSTVNNGNTKDANRQAAALAIRALRRDSDYRMARQEARGPGGDPQFIRKWDQYTREVPIDADLSFDDWKRMPRYDASGKLIQ